MIGYQQPLGEDEARTMSPLLLAYVGDTVHDLFVRTQLTRKGGRMNLLHREASRLVNARAQAAALTRIEGMLSEEEGDIVRRGRNAHARHAAPKHADPADYTHATGLEALLGYLYLTGRMARLSTLLESLSEPEEEAHA